MCLYHHIQTLNANAPRFLFLPRKLCREPSFRINSHESALPDLTIGTVIKLKHLYVRNQNYRAFVKKCAFCFKIINNRSYRGISWTVYQTNNSTLQLLKSEQCDKTSDDDQETKFTIIKSERENIGRYVVFLALSTMLERSMCLFNLRSSLTNKYLSLPEDFRQPPPEESSIHRTMFDWSNLQYAK